MPKVLASDSLIYVAGHRGMVGSAIIRELERQGFENIITRTRIELDLCDQSAVRKFFSENRIDCVVLAAAKVGGIYANSKFPADFIYQNMMIEANVIHEAYRSGVYHLLFLGSTCVYPKFSNQPMSESELLTGPLESTNEPYAVAKIAGIKLCESYNRQYGTQFRSVMPASLYGENDSFHPENSHVIPALLRRFHEAKEAKAGSVTVWGSGKAMREFLHVDDMAAASVHIMRLPDEVYEENTKPMLSHINVGMGKDITIRELAETMRKVVGFKGEILFDASKSDGTPKKLLDVSRLRNLGWRYSIELENGLRRTYRWFLEHQQELRHG